jgi:PhnB protein
MPIQPYLMFDGRCEEAVRFYEKAIGAKVEGMMRYKEAPEKPPPGVIQPGSDDKVMHCSVHLAGKPAFMCADDCMGGHPKFGGFSLTLEARDAAEANRLFSALGEGGKVTMPLGKTFFSPSFGMLQDKFGVGWMVIVYQPM